MTFVAAVTQLFRSLASLTAPGPSAQATNESTPVSTVSGTFTVTKPADDLLGLSGATERRPTAVRCPFSLR